MNEAEEFIKELFTKLRLLRPEQCSTEELYYAIYDTCGEWLERKANQGEQFYE